MGKITKSLFCCALITGLGFASQVLAHATGASFEQTVGDYSIDIGYAPEVPTADDAVRFDFTLKTRSTAEEVEFTNIWVRIEQGNKTFFAGSMSKARFGLTGLLYDFGEGGDYEIFARFENDEGSIVETSFPFPVKAGGEGGGTTNFILIFLGGTILGVLASMIINKKKK